jgi:hypothetical protein
MKELRVSEREIVICTGVFAKAFGTVLKAFPREIFATGSLL